MNLIRLRWSLAGLLILGTTVGAWAQPADTTAWTKELVGKFAATQVGFQNWQGGGVNAFALSSGMDGKFARQSGRWAQTHELRVGLGIVKQDTLDFRKAEDILRTNTTLLYVGERFFKTFNPTIAVGLLTQFAPGFNYDTDPISGTRTPPVRVSQFFAPAYLTEAVGLTWKPAAWVTQRFGFGAKQTIVTTARFRPLYGNDPDKSLRNEGGLEAKTEVDKQLMENVKFKSSLGLFAAFNQLDNPDVVWENLITMKVNKYMNVSFEYVNLYDRDVIDKVQLKEVLAVNVSFILL
jgi:hypothetical protein